MDFQALCQSCPIAPGFLKTKFHFTIKKVISLSLSLSPSFQYAQILKERLRESIHDVQYVEPPFDDAIADIGKEWKSTLAKLKFANSYRMEPLKKFQAYSVEAKVQQILKVGW